MANRLEGGAHVVMEASGTPVLASKIAGNVGMLGPDYAGYFEPGDAKGLADLLLRLRAEQVRTDSFYSLLQAQCARRAPLFAPATEKAALMELVHALLHQIQPEKSHQNACT